jgi:hypothetical protein
MTGSEIDRVHLVVFATRVATRKKGDALAIG